MGMCTSSVFIESVVVRVSDVVDCVIVGVWLVMLVMVTVDAVAVVVLVVVLLTLVVVAVMVLLVVLLKLVVVLLECGHWQPKSSTRMHAFRFHSTGRMRTF